MGIIQTVQKHRDSIVKNMEQILQRNPKLTFEDSVAFKTLDQQQEQLKQDVERARRLTLLQSNT